RCALPRRRDLDPGGGGRRALHARPPEAGARTALMPDDLTRRAGAEARLPLGRRLWIYQAERFPVVRSGALVAMFSAAGVSLSAVLAARPLPAIGSYAVAFVVAFIG